MSFDGMRIRFCAQIIFILGCCLVFLQFELISEYATLDPTYVKRNEDPTACDFNTYFGSNVEVFYPRKVIERLQNITIRSALSQVNITETQLFSNITDDKHAIFCSKRYKPEGTGNALAIYWTARSIAFYMNYSFILDSEQCDETPFKMFDKTKDPQLKWTLFLDKESTATLYNKCGAFAQYNIIASNYRYMWKYYANKEKRGMFDIPYRSYIMFLSYNPWFVQIIQRDTSSAFEHYYAYNKNMYQHTKNRLLDTHLQENNEYQNNLQFHESLMRDLKNKEQYIIVIHIRCGDIIFHHRRYLLNMKYFIKALQMIFDDIHDVNDKLYKFQIISQLSATNSHTFKDVDALPISQKVVYFMIQRIKKYIARKYDIKYEFQVIGNGTADNDYYQMITAPYLICSPSSFCFNAAVANYYDPQMIILPQIGAWKGQKRTYRQIANYSNYGILSHHKWLDTTHMFAKIEEIFDSDSPSEKGLAKFQKWFVGKKKKKKKKKNNSTEIVPI